MVPIMDKENYSAKVVGTFLQGLSNLLLDEGINVKEFYRQFGLNPAIEQNENSMITLEVFIDILGELKKVTSLKHPGLYLANFQLKQKTFLYFDLILCAPTIEVALQIARRFRYMYSEVAYWAATVKDGFCVIERYSFASIELDEQECCLYSLALVGQLLSVLLGSNSPIMRVSLIQPENGKKYHLERFFKCPVSFSQDFNGFIIPENYYYKYKANFDAQLYYHLLDKLSHHKVNFPKNQKFSSFIKGFILQTLSTGHCSLSSVAKQIGMHPKAVQKRLLKENLTFQSLISDVRSGVAKSLLVQQGISLIQISAMLGYSEPSAFSRAFQKLNQCSPREWRKNQSD